jgi:hypothetical protein
MKHFRVTFRFIRTVESDDPDAVARWAEYVRMHISPAIKDLNPNAPRIQVLGPADDEGVEVYEIGDVT